MHLRLFPLLATFALTAFTTTSFANTVTPKPGHYKSSHEAHQQVVFDLSAGGHVHGLKINGKLVALSAGNLNDQHVFRFHRGRGQHSGHGTWITDTRVEGDFRYYPGTGEHNDYHTWHAHWVSNY